MTRNAIGPGDEYLRALLRRWLERFPIFQEERESFRCPGAWCCDMCGAFDYDGPETIQHMDDCLVAATQTVLGEQIVFADAHEPMSEEESVATAEVRRLKELLARPKDPGRQYDY